MCVTARVKESARGGVCEQARVWRGVKASAREGDPVRDGGRRCGREQACASERACVPMLWTAEHARSLTGFGVGVCQGRSGLSSVRVRREHASVSLGAACSVTKCEKHWQRVGQIFQRGRWRKFSLILITCKTTEMETTRKN